MMDSPFSLSYLHGPELQQQHYTSHSIPQIQIPHVQIPKARNTQNLTNILRTYNNKKGIITSSDSVASSIGLGSVSIAEEDSSLTVLICAHLKDEKENY